MRREVPPTAGLPLLWRELVSVAPARSFERGLADLLQLDNEPLVTSSGTAALITLLAALKEHRSEQKRNSVIIPGYTCPLVAIAIAQAGLRIRLCDIDAGSCEGANPAEFDLQMLRTMVQEEPPLAVIPTHLAGTSCRLAQVIELGNEFDFLVIEDAAQALGATLNGRPLGTICDAGIFSLTMGKGLSIYEGGLVCVRDSELRARLQEKHDELTRNSSLLTELGRIAQVFGYTLSYNDKLAYVTYGRTLRRHLQVGDVAGAIGDRFPLSVGIHQVSAYRKMVGASALKRLNKHLRDCQLSGRARAQSLSSLPGLTVQREPVDCEGTWPFLNLVFQSEQACKTSLDKLWTSGLGVTKLFAAALQEYDYLQPLLDRGQPATPRSSSIARRSLTVTNNQFLNDEDFGFIRDTIAEVLCSQTAPMTESRQSATQV